MVVRNGRFVSVGWFKGIILLIGAFRESDAFTVIHSMENGGVMRMNSGRVIGSSATSEVTASSISSSASRYSGAGQSQVDMNTYNLSIDQIAEEWTANLVPQSSLREEGIYLGARNSRDIMVDTIKVEIPRRRNQGMGIELLEIAGGREDGLGITVINGLVEGGCADNGSDIMIGDSIAAITVKKTKRSNEAEGMSDVDMVQTIETECLGYDRTVEAILSLPPAESDDETIVLSLRRLRRKPKVLVKLQYPPSQNEPDTTIELFAGENLRRAMLTRGVKLNDPLSLRFDSGGIGDCGADGTCATCVISVVRGSELLNPQALQEAQILKKNPRWRMACKTVVGYGYREGEMTIQVNPRQWNN